LGTATVFAKEFDVAIEIHIVEVLVV